MPDKIFLSWEDIDQRAHKLVDKHLQARIADLTPIGTSGVTSLYGIPRGGYHAVQAVARALESKGLLCNIVENPALCDFLIDDIIDSGNTKLRWGRDGFCQPFFALVDVQGNDNGNRGKWWVFPWEVAGEEEAGPTENIVRLLQFINEDPEREGLKGTPGRVIKSYGQIYGGYTMNLDDYMKVFVDDACDEMVILKDIEFYSTCEHHMLPFYGKAHIAYIPNGKVLGVSKLARILDMYACRLQIQERLCQQVTDALDSKLKPLGSACVIEAKHFCMTARGVRKQNSVMVTSSLTGVFKEKPEARNEFLKMIGK